MWGPDQRGDALAIFSLMPFAGPALAPIVSGFMEVTDTNYKWIFWVLTIFAGVCLAAMIVILPETYVPFILQQEARKLRKQTGEPWISALERSKKGDTAGSLFKKTIAKPFIMIVQEPMLAVLTLYMSFVYGIIYLLFEAIPIVFEQTHGLNAGESGLVFLALLSGGVLGVISYIFYFNPQYVKLHHKIAPKSVPPEARLTPILFAAPAFAMAFFWFGWT
jgi:MFS family permease